VLDLRTRQRTTLIRGGSDARYVKSGHVLYAAESTLSAVRFDLERLAVVGDPVPVVDGVSMSSTGSMNAAVTTTGTLVFVSGGVGDQTPRSLVWVDRQGRETPISAPPGRYVSPRLSSDGMRVALEVRDPGSDVWVWDLTRQTLTRLTLNGGFAPVWMPDGMRLDLGGTSDAADAALLDPDWAVTGPQHVYRFRHSNMRPPADALLAKVRRRTANVALVLPPDIELQELAGLPEHERQSLYLEGQHALYCLYFGALMRGPTESELHF
jgi:hypothetical protein